MYIHINLTTINFYGLMSMPRLLNGQQKLIMGSWFTQRYPVENPYLLIYNLTKLSKQWIEKIIRINLPDAFILPSMNQRMWPLLMSHSLICVNSLSHTSLDLAILLQNLSGFCKLNLCSSSCDLKFSSVNSGNGVVVICLQLYRFTRFALVDPTNLCHIKFFRMANLLHWLCTLMAAIVMCIEI